MYLALDDFAPDTFSSARPRPAESAPQIDFAWRVLEEIDYGLILVSPQGRLQHANHLARHELARARFLCIDAGMVASHNAEQNAEVTHGIRWAARGRRQMLNLRHGKETLAVACVPLFQPFEGESASVLLMLARQAGTQNLAVTFFARTHRLTPAEEVVLKALCDGHEVQEIATANGVCQSTVRTQVRALRDKTSSASIRLLVQRVAALPPVVPVCLAMNGRTATQSGL